ncbi:hypothetical protein LCM10_03345 [Rossellomorea aquimaris]|uniref:hypothetical protein n=1 Tax=Rossellomorea aquimaris TaxID=189382 RepID=UPI001CD2A25A|nr:hypothetical protein [Rossellomorea aquimaris]MCA1054011.1 hypothetical protein [Rossellomorea aquimaris]
MKKLVFASFLGLSMAGCASSQDVSEVSQDEVSEPIQTFIEDVKEENGVHLYYDGTKAIYVYFNASNVKQGEEASHFSDVKVEEEGNTVKVLYSREEMSDDSNENIDYELLYKIETDDSYENLKLFENGKEVSFGTVSGNE